MGDVVRLPIVGQPRPTPSERIAAIADRMKARGEHRNARSREVRAKTTNVNRLAKRVVSLDSLVADSILAELGPIERPRTRGDCKDGPRPCPWVSCRHHLMLDVTNSSAGAIKVNFPDVLSGAAAWEDLPATCALDVADEGGTILDVVAHAMNVTRPRVQQLEASGLRRLRERGLLAQWDDHEPEAHETPLENHELAEEGVAGATSALAIDQAAEGLARGVWDLSQDETPERLATAQSNAYEMYERRLAERGLIRVEGKVHPLADERLAQAEKVIAARAAERNETTMPGTKPTDEQLAERREIIVNRLRLGGPSNAAAIASALSAKKNTIRLVMRKMVAAGELITNGKRGRAMLFGVPGTTFEVAAPRLIEPPNPARAKLGTVVSVKGKAVKVQVGGAPLTLADVAKKQASPRFLVRVEGLEVDCADAASVLELARAVRAS